ncbi:30S ribosomal protein S9 [Candidatus Bandiella euplotis]|uniref:Small ribosomal subunit protein uS9 n=1 Tax=Candidatus Bandiella euplotis TaxID=1664265 RepID=A0ABZ0UMX9_9RICK|nr:30S ribosomal protein S9 [Candidatus Bandiella woodruffii]WPX97302.1 30S ribosomal protein S9 [Candidatus Bandiella woodruffii]
MENKEVKVAIKPKKASAAGEKAQVTTKKATQTTVEVSKEVKASSRAEKKATSATAVPRVYATGKRKTAVAKVWMTTKGTGKIMVNGKPVTEYFQRPVYKTLINQPFCLLKADGVYDVDCQVSGSGLSGQAGAIRHGISKALNQISEEFRQALRSGGFLTRDSRQVERKKYGQPKARKRFQFSKR